MQEVFEKIIEKLSNEYLKFNEDDWNGAIDRAIDIVNQEVEKYNNKLIEEIKFGIEACSTDDEYNAGLRNGMRYCLALIDGKEPEFEPCNSGWIPCDERLPEEAFGCLVTVMDYNQATETEFENILPYVVGYDGNGWNDADGETIPFEVIAWKPLTETYHQE